MPTDLGVCLITASVGLQSSACKTTADSAINGLGIITPMSGGGYRLVGVLPDGFYDASVTTGDGTKSVTLGAQGGYAVAVSAAPTGFGYSDAAGTKHVARIEMGTPSTAPKAPLSGNPAGP